MAIDTAQKRMSAVHHTAPWRGPLVAAAEAGFTQGNRQAAAYLYSGILASAPVVGATRQGGQLLTLGVGA